MRASRTGFAPLVAPNRVGAALACALVFSLAPPVAAQAPPDNAIRRGEYVFHAANCYGCHTDVANKGEPLAGGRALKTPFGTFRSPNITPDPVHGIGTWSDADFVRALRDGVSPGGSHYFPVFPYTSYTKMSEPDMRDLKAYLFSLAPVAKPNQPHEVGFPFNQRVGVYFWKLLYFDRGPLPAEAGRDATWERGRYLTEALGHCAECHTPRNRLGALDRTMWMAGSADGAEGESTPNITPDPATGIGEWSAEDIAYALQTGRTPDGDSLGSAMAEVIEHGTSKLTEADLAAVAAYLKSLPPIVHRPGRR